MEGRLIRISMSPLEHELSTLESFDSAAEALTEWGCFVDRTLVNLFAELIRENRVKKPEFRLKCRRSYLKKALYRNKNYENPIVDITDKVGTRLIALTTKEIGFLTKTILECDIWKSKKDRDFHDEQQKNPELFDYQSVHIIVKPKEGYEVDPRYFDSLSCEIQIRSALQHAHAEVSHDTTYKGPYRYDEKIKRLLSLSMALREATDDYFCKVYDEMKNETRQDMVFINRLTSIFVKLKPDFDTLTVDYPLSDLLIQLWHQKHVELDEIEQIVYENRDDIAATLIERNGYLFSQPIVLLIAFYVIRYRDFIRKNWPLNSQSLEKAFIALGYDYREY